jgi:hypothetical protein
MRGVIKLMEKCGMQETIPDPNSVTLPVTAGKYRIMKKRHLLTTVLKALARGNGRCAICGRRTPDLGIEHTLPVRLGGTTKIDNLQAVCRSCNIRKGDRRPHEFASFQEEALRGYEFERIVANVLSKAGFGVLAEATGPDGGVDIVARRRDDKTGKLIELLVECKYRRRPLSVKEIAQFASNLTQLRLGYGVIVSNQRPTKVAGEHARSLSILRIPTTPWCMRRQAAPLKVDVIYFHEEHYITK